MKLAHISDLHIGKKVNGFSMIEDQRFILKKYIESMKNNKAEVILIAGDIYDKSQPSAEAVQLLDEFMNDLARLQIPVCIISGNHDSEERVAYGAKLFEQANIHVAPVFDGTMKKVKLEDGYGEINVYLLPFLKPAMVRRFYPDVEITNYTDAIKAVLDGAEIDTQKRNILVAHQFVAGAARSDSEESSVGGVDSVDGAVFADFNYVALGHIHKCQNAYGDKICYCGTPLAYSFSEVGNENGITYVEIDDKGKITKSRDIIKPLRAMREIKGTYDEITYRENYIYTNTNDYMHVTLTDEEDILDAIGKLRSIYPNIMKLDYDNTRTRNHAEVDYSDVTDAKKPLELFEEFYETQNNLPMSEEQVGFVSDLITEIWRI